MLNKKMDVNFAFAILLLVAAIVGVYFFLNMANEEVGDIYEEDNYNMIVERSDKKSVFDEVKKEDAVEDNVLEKNTKEMMKKTVIE
ncbi:MAG: hypothetical protein CR972_01955 [Candidatus Moraniibacteriota bacterium]|nr:MAG: hypothetical protein CR972_01955 [Candidatus Moranbacteria bacterium]